MQKIPTKRTSIENLLSSCMRKHSIRYRRPRKINGNPDFRIYKKKILIFCDGDFWHGYNFDKIVFKSNPEFWHAKLKRNIERDTEVNHILEARGWKVIRFWEHNIRKQLDSCIEIIKASMR